MKTPAQMLEDIARQLSENISLLDFVLRNTDGGTEKDCTLSCLSRSLTQVHDNVYEHIKTITENKTVALGIQKGSSLDFVDDVFNALTYAGKTREAASAYIDSYFSDKDNDDPKLLMASVIFDCAVQAHETLKNIETKLN